MQPAAARDMRLDDALASGDPAVIRAKLAALLRNVDDGGGQITIYSAQVCMAELLRISIEKVEKSSNRLEWLTKVLIVLTIILGLVAVPPAIDAIKHVFQ